MLEKGLKDYYSSENVSRINSRFEKREESEENEKLFLQLQSFNDNRGTLINSNSTSIRIY